MARRTIKAKEPVKLRTKSIKGGNQSYYLDYQLHGKRQREFLKLYLIPERTAADREKNLQTRRAAEVIMADKIRDIVNGKAHVKKRQSTMLLTDWLLECKEEYKRRGRTPAQNIDKLIRSVIEYRGAKVRLCDLDKEYCKGYYNYLRNERKNEINGKPLSLNTMEVYAGTLAACINAAKRAELILCNPFELVDRQDRIHKVESTRVFLTPEELEKLIQTPSEYPDIKNAFLFACYCGLRYSDIRALTWGDITTIGGKMSLTLTMKKTRRLVSVPISKTSRQFLPEKGNKTDADPVFHLQHRTWVNLALRKWIKAADIKKHISFHCSRHTFATLLLTQDVNLAVVQSLLGHTDVRSTQVYAKVIDRKKEEAVNLLDNVLNRNQETTTPATPAPAAPQAAQEPQATQVPQAAQTPQAPEPAPTPEPTPIPDPAFPLNFFLTHSQFIAEA